MNWKWSKGYEIKNEIKIKYWYECLHCSRHHKTKINKMKLLNRKIEIENEVKDMKLKKKLKLKQNIGMSVYIAVVNTKQK